MKKLELLIFIMFSLTLTGYSQTREKNTTSIIWDENSKCYEYNTPAVKSGNLKCGTIEYDGKRFKVIQYKGISYAVYLSGIETDSLNAAVIVANNSGKEIFVDPVNSKISKYKTEEQFRESTEASDTSNSISPKQMSYKIRYRSTGSAGVGTAAPNVQAQATISNERNTAGMVIIEPKSSSPSVWGGTKVGNTSSEKETGGKSKSGNKSLTQRIIDEGLLPKAVADKEIVTGQIYFKRYIGAKFRAVFMRVDDLEFVFPLR